MYRERYAQKTAVAMYYAQRPYEEVLDMILAEGAPEAQAAALAKTYYQDYLSLCTANSKQKRKAAGMFLTVGIVFVAGSVLLSFLMYLLIDDGHSFIGFYGVMLLGLGAIVKGLLDQRAAEKELDMVQSKQQAFRNGV